MRRVFIFVLIAYCMAQIPSFAEDWSDFSGNLWGEQKAITNDEFEKAIDTLQSKQKKKEAKQKKKKIKKFSGGGTSLHNSLDPLSEIQAQDPLKKTDKNEGRLLNIPVQLYIGDKLLDTGYYNVFGEKDKNGEIYLSFYQAHYFKGKVKANETKDDFKSDSIDFVKLIPYNEDYVMVGYGSLDFNAYVYIRYKNP